ncbi:MAG: tryptophan--tRNA ligase, partial [bacterium]
EIEQDCRKGKLGCVQCKLKLANLINTYLRPIREKRKEIQNDKSKILDIIIEGSKKAKKITRTKLEEVNKKINLNIQGVKL